MPEHTQMHLFWILLKCFGFFWQLSLFTCCGLFWQSSLCTIPYRLIAYNCIWQPYLFPVFVLSRAILWKLNCKIRCLCSTPKCHAKRLLLWTGSRRIYCAGVRLKFTLGLNWHKLFKKSKSAGRPSNREPFNLKASPVPRSYKSRLVPKVELVYYMPNLYILPSPISWIRSWIFGSIWIAENEMQM